MTIRIHLSNGLRQEVLERLRQADRTGPLRLVRRIHAVLAIADGRSVAEVAEPLHLSEQAVRDYVVGFILDGIASRSYRRPPGRPPKLTKTQRQKLSDLLTAGPEAAGYESGCWTAVVIQDLIQQHFGVVYHPQYICALLHTLGFSFQKARFVSDHLDAAARQEWETTTWPTILRAAREKGALIVFGDEASFAQWGSLSYTWASRGQQPVVKTCGKRKAYKVFGLIDFFSGRFFYQGTTERFNSATYAAFLEDVLAQTQHHLILIQDGAKYHTSKETAQFFADHADRLTKFQLPSYSPDFNPIEARPSYHRAIRWRETTTWSYHHHASGPSARRPNTPRGASLPGAWRAALGDRTAGREPAICSCLLVCAPGVDAESRHGGGSDNGKPIAGPTGVAAESRRAA